MSSRAGRSRIQFVLGLLIAAMVTGLVAVAVAGMREKAARMACANNLKQLGIAVHNYHDTGNLLPPLVDQGEGSPTGKGLPSMFAMLGPYLEASPGFFHEREGWKPAMYNAHSSVSFRLMGSNSGPYILTGGYANRTWRMLVDPADTTPGELSNEAYTLPDGTTQYNKGFRDVQMTLPDGTTGYYATGSYAANGLLPWGTKGLRDGFPNGAANAILLAERPQVCRDALGNTTYNLWGLGFYSPHMPAFATLTPTDPAGLWSTGQIAPALPLPDEGVAERDTRIQVRVGRANANPQPPDFTRPFQLPARNQSCDPRLPGSLHREGMQVAMADGSVRVFGPDTVAWVFWSACAPGDQ